MYEIDFQNPASVHFVGIGGISMSAIAELLNERGFRVSGSDRARSELTDRLVQNGISIFYGQRAENITDDIDCVVLTSAIREDNPEYMAAKARNLPILTRAQLLGQIMKNYDTSIAISGTHGKTTTTSMISEILMKADTDPTLLEGGILKSIGGNLRIGSSKYFVTEACEYTNSFLSFFPTIGLILNVEEDHLDFFKDIDDIRHSFRAFADLLPAHGCLILNGSIANYDYFTKDLKCQAVTFCMDPMTVLNVPADYYPSDITYDELGHASFTLHTKNKQDRRIALRVPGLHNVANAMAAIALADLLEIPDQAITEALADFTGADRRFEYKGKIGGVTIVDDYAHHPQEIEATLKAASNMPFQRTWCVFQPHTFSRTKAFMDEFAKALCLADKVVLTDIYAARETDHLGISSRTLQEKIKESGKECYYFSTFDETENFLLENCINGDLLITMGAGDVHKIGERILGL